MIKALSAENAVLKQQVGELEAALEELKQEASSRKADEQQLEKSLQGVLDVLDGMDDEEPETAFKATIVETGNPAGESIDETPAGDSTDDDAADDTDDDEENQVLFEDDDFTDADGESDVDESDGSDDTPEEIDLGESPDDENPDDKVQSEFDIF